MLLAAVAWSVAWTIAAAAVLTRRRPKAIPAGASTSTLGDESPAVANLLTSLHVTRDAPTGEAVAATVVDLASRGFVVIERASDQHCVLWPVSPAEREKRASEGGVGGRNALTRYEQQVLDLVSGRAHVDARIPLAAITLGEPKQADRWRRTFRRAVITEAQGRGLTTNVLDPAALATLALVLAAGIGLALLIASAVERSSVQPILIVLAAMAWVYARIVQAGQRQRPTPMGRSAARQWLGVRAHLDEGAFDTYAPDGVTIWGRHLAYATAFGVARGVLQAVPIGADDDHRAWTNFGHDWRQVRVRYPRLRPGWGRRPMIAAIHGFAGAAVALAAAWVMLKLANLGPADDEALDTYLNIVRTFGRIAATAFGLVAIWFIAELVASIVDLGSPKRVVGQVVRARTRRPLNAVSLPNGSTRARHYIAVDDGTRTIIDAYCVEPPVHAECPEGAIVALSVTPMLRHVTIERHAEVSRRGLV